MRTRLFILIGLVVLTSCFNEREYDFRNVSISPTYAFPIAFADMGLVDLLSTEDSSFVRVYPDGLLYFYYSETLASKDIHDMFSLPDNASTVAFALPDGTLPASSINVAYGTINQQIDLNLSPERLTEILLKEGVLNYSLGFSIPTSPTILPLEAVVTLTDVVHKTTGLPLTFTLTNGSGSTPIVDYKMLLVNNQFDVRVDLVLKAHPTLFIPPSSTANIELNFAGMDFSYIKGFLGDQTTQLPPQTIKLTVFGSALKEAGVSFVEPKLSMNVVNDYGAPCEVTFSVLRAMKEASILPILINPSSPVTLNSPTMMGQSATTILDIINESAVMNFGPEQLEYTASARINKGLSSGMNFLSDTSKLKVTLTTEIPIYGQVNGATISDTLEIDLGGAQDSRIITASLKISGRNEMPLDAYLQIYLTDGTHAILDSLFAPNEKYIVKASKVDAAGDLVSPGISELQFGLDPDKLTKLFDSKFLIIKAVMNTARDSNNTPLNVKFRATYRLKLNVGLRTKFNITLD